MSSRVVSVYIDRKHRLLLAISITNSSITAFNVQESTSLEALSAAIYIVYFLVLLYSPSLNPFVFKNIDCLRRVCIHTNRIGIKGINKIRLLFLFRSGYFLGLGMLIKINLI